EVAICRFRIPRERMPARFLHHEPSQQRGIEPVTVRRCDDLDPEIKGALHSVNPVKCDAWTCGPVIIAARCFGHAGLDRSASALANAPTRGATTKTGASGVE